MSFFSQAFLFIFQLDFNLGTKWLEYSYLYLYELFTKASVLKNDPSFFRPVSQLKTSVIVWYLINPEPPSSSVCQLTASQAKSIWNLTDEDLDRMNNEADGELSSIYLNFSQLRSDQHVWYCGLATLAFQTERPKFKPLVRPSFLVLDKKSQVTGPQIPHQLGYTLLVAFRKDN